MQPHAVHNPPQPQTAVAGRTRPVAWSPLADTTLIFVAELAVMRILPGRGDCEGALARFEAAMEGAGMAEEPGGG